MAAPNLGTANYDHPSFLTRQPLDAYQTTAGANGLSGGTVFPWAVRIRNAIATVRTAGTSTGNSVQLLAIGTAYQYAGTATTTLTGTTTLGSIALSTGAAYTYGTSGDLNTTLALGCALVLKNGTDATGVAYVAVEGYLDPVQAQWIQP